MSAASQRDNAVEQANSHARPAYTPHNFEMNWIDRVWAAAAIGTLVLLLAMWTLPLPRFAQGDVRVYDQHVEVLLPSDLTARPGARVSLPTATGPIRGTVKAVTADGRLLVEAAAVAGISGPATVELGWEPLLVWGVP